jgi:hypothetical protein
LEKKKTDEAHLDQQVNKERVSKLDMEVEISRLRSENIEAFKKLESVNMINLDVMVDMEEMKQKMDRDVVEIARLQKELKQAIQDRIALQEKLSEVIIIIIIIIIIMSSFLLSFAVMMMIQSSQLC